MRSSAQTRPTAVATERRRRAALPRPPSWVTATATALAVLALLLYLTRTLYSHPEQLGDDFTHDAWFIRQQGHWLANDHRPSLFLSADAAVLYPVFAFYGGTLFVAAGALSMVVGSAYLAEAMVYTAALAIAYGGWLWLARAAGIRTWAAHVPAVLYVTAPYVMTNIYSRQDLAETAATAAIPLLLASAISVQRADHLRAGPAAALALATILFTGSHNLTLLWGTTTLAIVGLAIALLVPDARRGISTRGVCRVLAVAAPAVAVNAWYLLPDLAYASQTVIADRIDEWRQLLDGPDDPLTLPHLLAPTRADAGNGSSYTLPVLGAVWAIVTVVMVRPSVRDTTVRLLALSLIVSAAFVAVLTHPAVLSSLPDPWVMIQDAGRLETFAVFCLCCSVIAGLRLAQERTQPMAWLLVPVLVLAIAEADGQVRAAPLHPFVPPVSLDASVSFGLGDYADGRSRVVPLAAGTVPLIAARPDVQQNRLERDVPGQAGTMVATNVMAPAGMLDVDGAEISGRWQAPSIHPGWQPLWYLVLRLGDAPGGRAHIVIREARSLPIVGGRILSLLGLVGLAANAGFVLHARRRARRPPSSALVGGA